MKKVGKPGLSNNITIPDDVEKTYGRTYNHLHLDIQHQPNIESVHYFMHDHINPLLVLKKLY